MHLKIPRHVLKAAVEDGIRAANFDEVSNILLRRVADEAKYISAASFWNYNAQGLPACGCPLTTAGLTDKNGQLTDLALACGLSMKSPFYQAYDAHVVMHLSRQYGDDFTRHYTTTMEVI